MSRPFKTTGRRILGLPAPHSIERSLSARLTFGLTAFGAIQKGTIELGTIGTGDIF